MLQPALQGWPFIPPTRHTGLGRRCADGAGNASFFTGSNEINVCGYWWVDNDFDIDVELALNFVILMSHARFVCLNHINVPV